MNTKTSGKNKKENLIHVRLINSEARQSKKEILYAQKNLLEILKLIKKYHLLRSEELSSKIILKKKLIEMKKNIKKLQNILPKQEIPERFKNIPEEKQEIEKPVKENYDKGLESQIQEIQEKLRSIETSSN